MTPACTARLLVEPGGWVRVSGLQPDSPDSEVTISLCHPGGDFVTERQSSDGLVVSTGSLLGRLLVGRRIGDTVLFDTAGGRVRLTILDAGSS